MGSKSVFVTGANGYIGNAVACAFVRAGWITYGLIRSSKSSASLEAEEIIPITGSIDDTASHETIKAALPPAIDVIVSTTENTNNFIPHFEHICSLLRTISTTSTANGVQPLVIYTAGSKDYGVGPHLVDDDDLKPHTEESELCPPAFAVPRVQNAPRIFQNTGVYAGVIVRPTNVYGRASSYYSICFRAGSNAILNEDKEQQFLIAPSRPNWICHALHIDDCAEAYVAIAGAPREDVECEVFNISSKSFETAEKILAAIVDEYGLAGGIKYVDLKDVEPWMDPSLAMVVGFPQWTSSEKLRRLTGWTDRRLPFSDSIHVYRLAYEAAVNGKNENVDKIGTAITSLMHTVQSL